MSKQYKPTNKMDCKEVKNRIFDFCEQFGPSAKLHDELANHITGCGDCNLYYNEFLKPGFKQLENEKHSELNPYLINKIMLKASTQNSAVFQKVFSLRTPVYVTSVLLAGVLTGILVSSITLPEADTASGQPDINNTTNTDANTSSDNSTLTLNDW